MEEAFVKTISQIIFVQKMASEMEKENVKPVEGQLGEDENIAIFLAVKRHASLEELEQLINQGEDWETTDHDGNTIVHVAAQAGNLEALKYFLEKGSSCLSVYSRNKNRYTPLINASRAPQNFMQIVNFLVENGADIYAMNSDGCNVLYYAVMYRKSLEDLEELERRGVPWDKYGENILHPAVQSGNLKALHHYITKGADVNAKDENGATPLIRTARGKITNFTEVVDLLVENGADLQAVDKYGKSILPVAVKLRKSISHVKFLVERGCAWNKPCCEGKSVLHLAAKWGNLGAIKFFMSLVANVNSRCKKGWTPLFLALYLPAKTFFQTVELLVRNGGDINAATHEQKGKFSVLHCAAEKGDVDKCTFLISLGANVNARNEHGATPIMYACPENASAVVKALVDHGADIRQTDWNNSTLIDYCVVRGASGTELNALIKMGARWDTANRVGKSVLHLAALYGNLEALRYFLSRGMDANGCDVSGRTPLLSAVKHKSKNVQEVAEILVEHGADINAVDNQGKNAVRLGLENGLDKLGVEKLKALGCC